MKIILSLIAIAVAFFANYGLSMAEDCSGGVKRHSETLYAHGTQAWLACQKSGRQNPWRDGARRGEGAIEPPLFLRTRRGSRVRGASAQVFARVSLANHLSWSGAFGWIAYFLTTRRLEK